MIESKDCWLKPQCKQLHCNDCKGCMILFKLNHLYEEALVSIPQRRHIELRIDADGTDLEEFQQLKNIEENVVYNIEEGLQLYIHSPNPGCGKTSWALRLLQTYFNRIWLKTDLKCRALFINVPSFLLQLKNNITLSARGEVDTTLEHIKKNIETCDLVIWDDIGHKIGTEFEITHLLSMIDTRINNNKANIYTSNIDPKCLGAYLDIRLASRIASKSTCIKLNGGDKRGWKE